MVFPPGTLLQVLKKRSAFHIIPAEKGGIGSRFVGLLFQGELVLVVHGVDLGENMGDYVWVLSRLGPVFIRKDEGAELLVTDIL